MLAGQLRTEAVEFLEGGSEVHQFGGVAFDRPAPRGAAWAASLAVAVRPQLFGLGVAPLALAGLMPRSAFRIEPEDPIAALLGLSMATASGWAQDDLDSIHSRLANGLERVAGRYASSHAPAAWALLLGLGALTRAELARALKVTPRTASQIAVALEQGDLIAPPAPDRPLEPILQRR